MKFHVVASLMAAVFRISQAYLSATFAEGAATAANRSLLLDRDLDTCTTFTVANISSLPRYMKIRLEEPFDYWQQKSITLTGMNLGCDRNLFVSPLSEAEIRKEVGRWKNCLLVETAMNGSLESCLFRCNCSGSCSSIQILKIPFTLSDSNWKICDISMKYLVRGCNEVPKNKNGVYVLGNISSEGIITSYTDVYCDMTTDNGGWMVIARRMDGSVNFSRNWQDYKQGFGSVEAEFWAGNELVHKLTTDGRNYSLRVDMEAYDGDKIFIIYDNFWIGPESDDYRLHISGYFENSTGGDCLAAVHNEIKFSTFDRDNDWWSDTNCAVDRNGWWHKACFGCSVAAPYGDYPEVIENMGIKWVVTWGSQKFAKYATMMIRPH